MAGGVARAAIASEMKSAPPGAGSGGPAPGRPGPFVRLPGAGPPAPPPAPKGPPKGPETRGGMRKRVPAGLHREYPGDSRDFVGVSGLFLAPWAPRGGAGRPTRPGGPARRPAPPRGVGRPRAWGRTPGARGGTTRGRGSRGGVGLVVQPPGAAAFFGGGGRSRPT